MTKVTSFRPRCFMNNFVMIKGIKSGIMLVLDEDVEFSLLLQHIADKFKESSKFLGETTIAISFEGRELDNEQQRIIIDTIHENSKLHIACIIENNPTKEEFFQRYLQEKLVEQSTNTGQFYKGNLRSGQVLDVETSIIVIGDVKNGAKVVSKGNIIILGSLKGNVFAGASGNENAFVVALEMNPLQVRIADVFAKAPDDPEKIPNPKEAKIAYVEDGSIYIEPLSRDVLNDICL